MSTEQVQAALMRLVRYPASHRGEDMDAFVDQFDLGPDERWLVRALASSFYVSKFGRSQRHLRFVKSVRSMLFVFVRLVGEEIAEAIFADRFEPAHPALGVAEIGDAFVAWLLANQRALGDEFGWPRWTFDLVRYEYAHFCMSGELAWRGWRVPPGARLRPEAPVTFLALGWDIHPFVEEVRALTENASILDRNPQERANLLMFARVPNEAGDGHFLYCCEVDESVRAFVDSERNAISAPLHPAFATLVELGIGRAR